MGGGGLEYGNEIYPSIKNDNFLPSSATISFSRRTLLYVVMWLDIYRNISVTDLVFSDLTSEGRLPCYVYNIYFV
jgi:hypothetical protein